MAVLYRKYRPQTFSQVVGQKFIIQTLKSQVVSGSLAHAYLFTGSRGVGKTSVARILAKAVNCTTKKDTKALSTDPGDACGICDICKHIEQGSFLDLVEIDAASNTGVDNIRDLIDHVKFAPSLGKYKVFIIDEVHMLSKGAFNALLKTLEEPPVHAVFILATTEVNKVPATIISRTQRFDFKALTATELEDHINHILEKEILALPAEIVLLIAQNAQGSGRDALSLLDKVLTLGENASIEECLHLLGITDLALCEKMLQLIAGSKTSEIPEFFTALVERGVDFSAFNRDFLEYLRKALVLKVTGKQETGVFDEVHAGYLLKTVTALTVSDLILITRLFLKSFKELSGSPSPEIPLLLAALEAGYRRSPIQVPSVTETVVTPRPLTVAESEPIAEGLESRIQKNDQAGILVPKADLVTESAMVEDQNFGASTTGEIAISSFHQELATNTSFEEVEKNWLKIIEKIKHINSPLAQMVRTSPLEAVSNGRVVIKVKFQFHKQNIENVKNATIICQAIEDVCGKKLGILAVVVKGEAETKIEPTEALADALKIFGGEVIQ